MLSVTAGKCCKPAKLHEGQRPEGVQPEKAEQAVTAQQKHSCKACLLYNRSLEVNDILRMHRVAST